MSSRVQEGEIVDVSRRARARVDGSIDELNYRDDVDRAGSPSSQRGADQRFYESLSAVPFKPHASFAVLSTSFIIQTACLRPLERAVGAGAREAAIGRGGYARGAGQMAPGAPDDPYALFSDDLLGMAAGVGGAEEEDDLRNRVLNGADDDAGDGARARRVHHHLHGGHQRQPQQPHPPRSRYPDPAPLGGGGNGRGRGGDGGGRYDESEFFHDALHGGATFGDHLDGALGVDAGPIDELDGDDEIEQQEWPSPAELLADTKAMLATADDLIKRDGKNPPPEAMRRLDARLRAIVASQKTTPRDDQKRQTLLRRFADMLRRKFPGVTLRPFGSFVSVFHTASSDIDISLEVAPSSKWYDPKEMGPAAAAAAPGARGAGRNRRLQQPRGYKSRKVQLLHKVASELRYQAFSEVNLIAHARVPLIKFKDPQTGVNCDVCVGNDGVYKVRLGFFFFFLFSSLLSSLFAFERASRDVFRPARRRSIDH